MNHKQHNSRLYFARKLLCISLLATCLVSYVGAAPKKPNAPIVAFADQATFDSKQGVGRYLGNVEVRQGPSRLFAARAETYLTKKHKLYKAIAFGSKTKRAHYSDGGANTDKPLHAYATTITYYPLKALIVLQGNAEITQGQDKYAAPLIKYYLKEQRLESSGRANGKRTRIVLTREL